MPLLRGRSELYTGITEMSQELGMCPRALATTSSPSLRCDQEGQHGGGRGDEDHREATYPQETGEAPFPCTPENIPRLKHWLEDMFATSSFNTSSAPMAKMSGPPMKIHVDPKAIPVAE